MELVTALQGEPWAPFAFTGVLALASLGAPITLLVVAGGVLFGFWGGLACNVLGTTAGAALAFWLARKGGRERVEGWLSRRRGEKTASFKATFRGILAVRLLGIPPFGVLNYLAGLTRASWKTYLAATVLGGLPWLIVITYLSQTLWSVWRASGMKGFSAALGKFSLPIAVTAAVAIGTVYVGKWLKKRRRRATNLS